MSTSNQPLNSNDHDEVCRQIADVVELDAAIDFGSPPHPSDQALNLPPGDWIPDFGLREPSSEEPPEWLTAPPIFGDKPSPSYS
ncbi:hypothetical protein [Bradyrhizobium sp. 2S1]|uniref:hypothetical protein n=1 Tax=Bradyrhizobium sp. 2S1 TaxID=1404429 RepID=UPI001409B25E|nr:hypothetical protein [Bradyrhizobium sp. 2S1]MCK7666142.1 hypothetical protein [Bradyrhizobium sp. 2S1]